VEIAEKRQIREAIVSRTIGDRPLISYREFRNSPVPAGVKGYLAAAQLQAMNRMSGATAAGPAETTSGALVRKALLASLVADKQFSREEFIGEIGNAVEFLAGYLVTPQRSLLDMVFVKQSEVPVAAFLSALSLATEYRYLPVLLAEWIRRRNTPRVALEEVRRVLRSMDRRVVEKHTEEELVLLARPLFEFASFGEEGGTLRAPAADLRLFYEEKGLGRFWQGISAADGTGNRLIEFAFLKNPQQVAPSSVGPVADSPAVAEGDQKVEHGHHSSEQDRNHSGGNAQTSQPIRSSSPSLPDLSSMISSEERDLFVKRLFEHDGAFYSAIISSLNGISTWKEAALYLSQFYQTNDLDPFADHVVEFTDAIHRRYVHEGVS